MCSGVLPRLSGASLSTPNDEHRMDAAAESSVSAAWCSPVQPPPSAAFTSAPHCTRHVRLCRYRF